MREIASISMLASGLSMVFFAVACLMLAGRKKKKAGTKQ